MLLSYPRPLPFDETQTCVHWKKKLDIIAVLFPVIDEDAAVGANLSEPTLMQMLPRMVNETHMFESKLPVYRQLCV